MAEERYTRLDLNRDVRNASPADRDLVASIITLAFANDPLWRHAMTRPDKRTEHHREFWLTFVDGALRYPWTWIAGAGDAVSIWIPPGKSEMNADQEEHLAGLAAEYLGPAAGDYLDLLARDLELIDGEGFPAYLESSNPANNRRYAMLGFEPIGEFSYPRNGPRVTTMWRPEHHSSGNET